MRRTVVAFAALMGIALGGATLVDRDSPAGAAPREWGRHGGDSAAGGGWGGGRGDGRGGRQAAPAEAAGTPTATPVAGSGAPAAPTASPSSSAGAAPAGAAPGDEAEVVRLLNDQRAANGCGALRIDARLTAVAQAQSTDMADLGYFDHERPDGSNKVGDRVRAAGFAWTWVGEVIAGGQSDPAGAVDAWLNSPGHRAIVLDCTAAAIGVGRDPRGNLWTATLGTE